VDAREGVAVPRAGRRRRLNSERFRRVDALFAGALERTAEERRRFLDEQCAADTELREEVETMLQLARVSEEFLETPVFASAAGILTAPADAIDHARFIPGDLVAARYRIVGLLGRGGMGEVYRADDLRLSQPVALKFLAEALARDGAALARFHREVSVARRISHRHVCRVYDIGEHAGMQFLSMEYIRGEELSSLLKRIGRLPHDKALDVARQLCSGLAAIHGAGVLHRDLKPANIMIDEQGDVRITDFGIVALAEGVSGSEAMIGTPAYMSPEQRSGGELTTRSDIYALGLVLYECFTGKRRSSTSSSAAVPELAPEVERVIARCLEDDPEKRPASALQVAAMLPGGDPLAAALAAGETPSPEMVAAAPKQGSLRPAVAASLVAVIVGAIVVLTLLSSRTRLHRLVPLDRPPALLQETAAQLARSAGYTAPRDTRWGFFLDDNAMRHARSQPERLRRGGQPAPITFWYRQSPQSLVAMDGALVMPGDPPMTISGMVQVLLDPQGRLISFEGVPPQIDVARDGTVDWARFFAAAGLDPSRFRRIASQWTPPQHSDARVAWSNGELRIEAASYRGQPTYFDVIGPWRVPERQEERPDSEPRATILLLGFYFGALTLGVLLAWKNLRLGRGDHRGALRLVAVTFVARLVLWVMAGSHVASVIQLVRFIEGMQSALYWACTIGLLHLALEPFVRRRWPEWVISWSRLLAGDARDPLVGRDVLIGGAFAAVMQVGDQLHSLIAILRGEQLPGVGVGSPRLYDNSLLGASGFTVSLVNQVCAAFLFSFVVISVLLFLTMVTRRPRIAIVIAWLLFYSLMVSNGGSSIAPLGLVLGVITPTLLLVVLTRYGVLALMSTMFFLHLMAFYPVTTELSAWYATSFLLEVLVLLALAVYGFRTSIAGQRVAGWLDE